MVLRVLASQEHQITLIQLRSLPTVSFFHLHPLYSINSQEDGVSYDYVIPHLCSVKYLPTLT